VNVGAFVKKSKTLRAAAFGASALADRLEDGGGAPPLASSAIEDYADIRVVLKPLDEMPVEPRMGARNDEYVAHGCLNSPASRRPVC